MLSILLSQGRIEGGVQVGQESLSQAIPFSKSASTCMSRAHAYTSERMALTGPNGRPIFSFSKQWTPPFQNPGSAHSRNTS